ncbi:MAG: DEAD/DEAH box helicase [Sandaracinaceae bacterium]
MPGAVSSSLAFTRAHTVSSALHHLVRRRHASARLWHCPSVPRLSDRLPARTDATPEVLLERFVAHVEAQGLSLYPAQEEAILALFAGQHVVLNTPTGSGKSLVALALHFKTVAEGGRSYYTAPIKALVSEKFFALCDELGAENVGLMTGDATVNRGAPVICCTAEILANVALHEGARADADTVVIDEFHFYGDRDRGMAWQLPLLILRDAQFLLMSATLGDVAFFAKDLEARSGREVTVIQSVQRPVPLEYVYAETPLHETLAGLVAEGKTPVYVVHFTQRAAAELAQDLMSVELIGKDRKQRIKELTRGFRWDSPFGKDLARYVHHGVGIHHAGLLPKYRLLVEKLAQKGLLAVICGTDTLGVGVNVPIRSVLFTQLCKYDGKKTTILSVRDFQQIAGRAGRKGFDEAGTVVVQAPEHAIENRIARMKAEGDPKKLKKLVTKKPPEKGYAHWDEQTFQRLAYGQPETLESRFQVTHGILLETLEGAYERGEDGCAAIEHLIRESHESRKQKFAHARHVIRLFRSLAQAKILETVHEDGRRLVRVNTDLQEDFSLHHVLSLFAVDLVRKLDRQDPLHALDVLTIVEATLEDPTTLLLRQLDKLKAEKLEALKAEGVPFEDRMAELEKVDNPRPRLDLLLTELDAFAQKHPWVSEKDLAPKSIARDMFERGLSFSEYVREYGLERAEGLLLRYLSEAYKGLRQTVPEDAKTDDVLDLEDWLRTVVRSVDSSLLDEWERLAAGGTSVELARPTDEIPEDREVDITENPRAFGVLVRNAAFRFVQALSRRRWGEAARLLAVEDGVAVDPARLEQDLAPYFDVHDRIRTDGVARAPVHTRLDRREQGIAVSVTLLGDEETDWVVDLFVPYARSRREVTLELVRIGPV